MGAEFIINDGYLEKYTGTDTSVVIPDGVKEIGEEAFSGCVGLTSVSIAEGVEKIGFCAFYGCKSLTSVKLPDSITEIDNGAFSGCRNLKSVTIPDSITSIGSFVFEGCEAINVYINGRPEWEGRIFKYGGTIVAPELLLTDFSSTEDKRAALRGFLRNPSLYTDAEVIGSYHKYMIGQRKKLLPDIFKDDNAEILAFYGENKKITVRNFNEEYFLPAEKYKAQNCIAFLLDWKNKNISEADIERELEREFTKDPYNIADMKRLWSYENTGDGNICITGYKGTETEVFVPERIGKKKVTRIGANAFSIESASGRLKPEAAREVSEKITVVHIPDGVTAIGDKAFSGCVRLVSVKIPAGVREIGGGAFSGCEYLTSVSIPDGLGEIEDSMLEGCKALSAVTVPRGVKKIGDQAFCGCEGIMSVSIPEGVEKIGFCSFSECKNITSVKLPDSITAIGARAFSWCEKLTSVTIPGSVKEIGSKAFFGCLFLTIHAPKGSVAEEYARKEKIRFEAI